MAEIQVVYVDSGDCGICGNGLWGGPPCAHKLAAAEERKSRKAIRNGATMTNEIDTPLTADRVEAVFRACLFTAEEDMADMVRVEGILDTFGFHPGRIEEHKAEIIAMLDELPDSFKRDLGGGMSFLNACNDRHGRQWTGLHQTMDHLFSLGQAVGAVELPMPRAVWAVLPGGMPYYVVAPNRNED